VNLGNPKEFTIRQLAETVIELTGSSSQLVFKPLPSDDPLQRQPDISLAQATLGWTPTIELRDGLGKTIEYFEKTLEKA
jgi:UDP-glucuronate decarboxylase